MKDYSQRQGHLTAAQERAVKDYFSEHPARNVDEVCAHILAEYGRSYSPSGAAKLMRRLGFEYKKPRLLPAQADEAKQAAFIASYESLMQSLAPDEMVVFSDAWTCMCKVPASSDRGAIMIHKTACVAL